MQTIFHTILEYYTAKMTVYKSESEMKWWMIDHPYLTESERGLVGQRPAHTADDYC